MADGWRRTNFGIITVGGHWPDGYRHDELGDVKWVPGDEPGWPRGWYWLRRWPTVKQIGPFPSPASARGWAEHASSVRAAQEGEARDG